MTRVTLILISLLVLACTNRDNIHQESDSDIKPAYTNKTLNSILASDSFQFYCSYFNCFHTDSIIIERNKQKLIFNHEGFPFTVDTFNYDQEIENTIRELVLDGLQDSISWDSFGISTFRGYFITSNRDSLSFVGKDTKYLDEVLGIGKLSVKSISRLWKEKN